MEIRKLKTEEFPKSLLEIPQPPKNLWVVGDLPDEDMTYLCVVGSRKFTSYGKEACQRIIQGLRGYPIVIVSGLALGIDAIAHKAALDAGLKTMVFPGSGLSTEALHPKTNLRLAREVVQSGGCLISEFEPSFKATLWSFPMRNRLKAGISKAVLIIEAAEKSGTLITARLALDYNKDVMVVPGSIFSPNTSGVHKLLRDGATPVTSAEDVLEALGFAKRETPVTHTDITSEEEMVLKLLEKPLSKEELITRINMPIMEANTLLLAMEIKGLIKEELSKFKIDEFAIKKYFV